MNNTITFYNGTKLPDPVMTISSTGITVNPNIDVDEIAKVVLAALDESIKRMVQVAVEEEREACARVCEEVGERRVTLEHKHITTQCAAAIRARKETQ